MLVLRSLMIMSCNSSGLAMNNCFNRGLLPDHASDLPFSEAWSLTRQLRSGSASSLADYGRFGFRGTNLSSAIPSRWLFWHVQTCNKLASRHIRVQIAEPSAVGQCDICEKSPAFFFCVIDGSSLCMECDVIVHVGGKRSNEQYLLLRQKIEFLEDKPGHFEDLMLQHHDNTEVRLENNIVLHKKQFLENIREDGLLQDASRFHLQARHKS